MIKLIEQDLESIKDTLPDEVPIDNLDLEDLVKGEGEEGEEIDGKKYQYTLKVRQEETPEDELAETYTFLLKSVLNEEEGDDELEEIEDTSEQITNAESPESSIAAPAPTQEALPESKETKMKVLKEQDELQPVNEPNTPGMSARTPTPQAAPENTPPINDEAEENPEDELEEDEGKEFTEEDLKTFVEGTGIAAKYFIDDETEFNVEEAIDYLKLYPDTEVYIWVETPEEFEEKLQDFESNKTETTDEVANEKQNVMVDQEGDNLELSNKPQPTQTPQANMESFSILNIKGKKNLPDGIYIANILENKIYGRIDVKLTKDSLILGKEVFGLKKDLNLKEAKDQEKIELELKENKDVERLNKILKEKTEFNFSL